MKGNNELRVCEAELMDMVQYFLNTKYLGLLRAEVTGIDRHSQSGEFVIQLSETASDPNDRGAT